MDISQNGKDPQIIHFNGIFHDKPSICGYPHDYGNPESDHDSVFKAMVTTGDPHDSLWFSKKHRVGTQPGYDSQFAALIYG